MARKKPSAASRKRAKPTLAKLLDGLSKSEGFNSTCLPDVRIMRSTQTHPSHPVAYEPSIVIVAQGRTIGRLGGRRFSYDARKYLVLAVPLPFECETIGTVKEPMLAISVRVNPATVAELLLEQDAPVVSRDRLHAIDATPISPEMSDAVLRLAGKQRVGDALHKKRSMHPIKLLYGEERSAELLHLKARLL